ncbi:Transcriptional regulator KdgR [Pontiella desulfatans]|uniref:Transcriptional regulator KdgR n=1 Tax=Pontiella desulfatans TaxID=2750659 RepID=A0A6C2U2E4_PONDE|nr:IclR family transcriptional regulator [Pontiella desulfatans]VGO13751.1 Transcriptional regulator KdgR [Pontiella desulfatans]
MAKEQQEDFKESRYKVPNLERALVIMEHLLDYPQGLSITEITEHLGLSKNSVFRITMTLLGHGYVVRDEQKRFSLSKKLLLMGCQSMGEYSFIENSLDIMRLCRDEIKESVFIGTLIENEGVVIEQVLGSHPFKFTIDSGHRLPLHAAAPCKAMLAFLPENELRERLQGYKFTRYNENTITTRTAFDKEMAGIKADGFALDRAEQLHGAHCISAPVFNQYGYPIAAIWTTGPSDRLPASKFPRLGKVVRGYADLISRRMGHDAL